MKKLQTQSFGYVIGQAYLIRTVTMIYTGRLVGITDQELWIAEAAWIAETERYADTLRSGGFREVEPYPHGVVIAVGRGAIVDAAPWSHALPRSQK